MLREQGAIVGRKRLALAAPLVGEAILLAALLVLLSQFLAELRVAFRLAGGDGVDTGGDRFHRQRDDIYGRACDCADDAAGQREAGGDQEQLLHSNGDSHSLPGPAMTDQRCIAASASASACVSSASSASAPGGSDSRPTITISGTAIGVIRPVSTWSIVAEARSTRRTRRPSSVIRRRASSQAARSRRCCGS